jgi:methyltransferase (TIGR00027 family)
MSNNTVEQKPSETASFAALRRAIAHKEFNNHSLGPDYLAEYFLDSPAPFLIKFKITRGMIKNRLDRFLPGLYEFVIARTAFFDRTFADALKEGIPQIVLLGAGYDSRAYRFASVNTATQIIELDIAPTQNRKKECLQKANIDIPDQVTFVPIDFNQDSSADKLGGAGYENHQETLFLWEGVSYYLDPSSVDGTLEFVSQNSHPKSAIAFDYAISISSENIDNYFGVREFTQTMQKHHADEQLLFSIDEGNTESYLAGRGLKIVNHLDNKAIESEFLMAEDGSLLGPITGHFRFVLASPIIG